MKYYTHFVINDKIVENNYREDVYILYSKVYEGYVYMNDFNYVVKETKSINFDDMKILFVYLKSI